MVILDSFLFRDTLYFITRGFTLLNEHSYARFFADRHLFGGSVQLIDVPGSIFLISSTVTLSIFICFVVPPPVNSPGRKRLALRDFHYLCIT